MRDISAFELIALVDELQELVGAHIERFYEVDRDRLRFKLTKERKKIELQCILAKTLNQTNYVEKKEDATNFAIAARKRLDGFVIQEIKQYNNDRIILFKIAKGEETSNAIFEMFGQGNLVITDSDMKILLCYKVHDFKDRSVRPGVIYKPPANAGPKKQMEALSSMRPVIYRDKDGNAVDYAITELEKYKDLQVQEFKSLQEALDTFYNEALTKGVKEVKSREVEELESSLHKQKKIIEDIDLEINNNKLLGEVIFKNMNIINQLIKSGKDNKKITKEELQRLFPNLKILEVDLKEKTIKFEL